jgi:hypothetical protein
MHRPDGIGSNNVGVAVHSALLAQKRLRQQVLLAHFVMSVASRLRLYEGCPRNKNRGILVCLYAGSL